VCSFESFTEPIVDDRVRLDPLDPTTSRHAGEGEYISETDPSVLKVLLKVKPGLDGGYDWGECGACGAGWQVPHFESVG
jgi:hypothetical protein